MYANDAIDCLRSGGRFVSGHLNQQINNSIADLIERQQAVCDIAKTMQDLTNKFVDHLLNNDRSELPNYNGVGDLSISLDNALKRLEDKQ